MKKKIFWTVVLTLIFGCLLTYFINDALGYADMYSAFTIMLNDAKSETISNLYYWYSILYLIDEILAIIISVALFATYVSMVLSLYKPFALTKILPLSFITLVVDLHIFMLFLSPVFSMKANANSDFSPLFIALPILLVCVSIVFGYFIRKEWQKLKAEKNKPAVEEQTSSQEEN